MSVKRKRKSSGKTLHVTFEQVIEALLDESQPFHPRNLYRFSDIEGTDLRQLEQVRVAPHGGAPPAVQFGAEAGVQHTGEAAHAHHEGCTAPALFGQFQHRIGPEVVLGAVPHEVDEHGNRDGRTTGP